jgi:hypothetical protein
MTVFNYLHLALQRMHCERCTELRKKLHNGRHKDVVVVIRDATSKMNRLLGNLCYETYGEGRSAVH